MSAPRYYVELITWTYIGLAELAQAQAALTRSEQERINAAHRINEAANVRSIPKPKGSAGGGKNGFNLRLAMGLADDKLQYSYILVCYRSLHVWEYLTMS